MQNKIKKRYMLIALVGILLIAVNFFSVLNFGLSEKEKAKIIKTGTKATATLLSVERTGTIVNSIQQYKLVFQIQSNTADTFEISYKELLDPLYMHNIKIGMEIPAYISSEGKKQVVILFEKVGLDKAF